MAAWLPPSADWPAVTPVPKRARPSTPQPTPNDCDTRGGVGAPRQVPLRLPTTGNGAAKGPRLLRERGRRNLAMAKKGEANGRLAVERRRHGWSQDDLVDRLYHAARLNKMPATMGLNVNYISRWERAVNQPELHHAHLL